MARFSRIEVAQKMESTGMVPLFYYSDAAVAVEIVKACYAGGARVIEFTDRGDGAIEVFKVLSALRNSDCPELALGIGSVTDAAMASVYMMNGADFIVTPVFREDIAIACNRRKVLWAPGCGSLSEIARAEELGCEIVKLFPGAIYGPGFVKAALSPCPWTKIMPTGGVTPEKDNLKSWFDAGVTCVGLGSQLISKSIIENKDYDLLKSNVQKAMANIKEVRA